MDCNSCTETRYCAPLTERPSSMRAQLNGSTSPSATCRPNRFSQSAMAQALLQAHWFTKWVTKASPSTTSAASSTRCPSDSHSDAVACTAATQSGWTSLRVGDAVMTATRNSVAAAAAAAEKEGPRNGGAQ